VVLGAGCTLASCVDRFRTPALRPYRALMFISLGLSGVVPVFHAITIYGYAGLEKRMCVSWVITQGALYIFGAVLYAARFPERSAPGTFDIWGNSHQLFHGLVVLAAGVHLWGMAGAFDYHHTGLGWQCMLD
jgi:adiponectin receptor